MSWGDFFYSFKTSAWLFQVSKFLDENIYLDLEENVSIIVYTVLNAQLEQWWNCIIHCENKFQKGGKY